MNRTATQDTDTDKNNAGLSNLAEILEVELAQLSNGRDIHRVSNMRQSLMNYAHLNDYEHMKVLIPEVNRYIYQTYKKPEIEKAKQSYYRDNCYRIN